MVRIQRVRSRPRLRITAIPWPASDGPDGRRAASKGKAFLLLTSPDVAAQPAAALAGPHGAARRRAGSSQPPRPPQPSAGGPPAAPPAAGAAARRPARPFVWRSSCASTQGNESLDRAADLPLLHPDPRPSRPSEGVWVPYDDRPSRSLLEDFKRLWATPLPRQPVDRGPDDTFPNGVIGKLVVYNMEERPRVKIVDYREPRKIERTKIDEKLKELASRAPPRLVPRRGRDPPGRGHRPRA